MSTKYSLTMVVKSQQRETNGAGEINAQNMGIQTMTENKLTSTE